MSAACDTYTDFDLKYCHFFMVFAIFSFYDHFYICQDTLSESPFAHYLNHLCQKFKREKDCLLLLTEVKDSSAVWI